MNKNPLTRNTRFDVLKSDETNPFMQRRTKSYPSMRSTKYSRNEEGNVLRRIKSARFESKNNIKYKPRLDVNSMKMFPKLGDITVTTKTQTGPSFSKIIQNLEESTKIDEESLPKGWVRLTRNDKNQVNFEYNNDDSIINYEEDYHDRAQRIITSMIYRWQSERDEQNEIYGDMSPYWNTPSLLEPQYDSEEELENEEEYEDN